MFHPAHGRAGLTRSALIGLIALAIAVLLAARARAEGVVIAIDPKAIYLLTNQDPNAPAAAVRGPRHFGVD